MSFYTARAWKNKTDQARACKSSLNQTSINGLTKKKKKKNQQQPPQQPWLELLSFPMRNTIICILYTLH